MRLSHKILSRGFRSSCSGACLIINPLVTQFKGSLFFVVLTEMNGIAQHSSGVDSDFWSKVKVIAEKLRITP